MPIQRYRTGVARYVTRAPSIVVDLCAARRTLAHVAERRGHDLDVVTEPHEPGDELVCDDDRPAESVRGPVRGAREQDPERGAHAREPTSKIV